MIQKIHLRNLESSINKKLSFVDKDSLFDEGYVKGFEAAKEEYLYDDFEGELGEEELRINKDTNVYLMKTAPSTLNGMVLFLFTFAPVHRSKF